MVVDTYWLIGVLFLCWVGLMGLWWLRQPTPHAKPVASATVQRLLKPCSPHDCPTCRRLAAPSTPTLQTVPPPPVRPWREVKSRRGAPKRINTEGFACPTHVCAYYRITDAEVHALVGDGAHGRRSGSRPFAVRRAGPRSVPVVIPRSIGSKRHPRGSQKL